MLSTSLGLTTCMLGISTLSSKMSGALLPSMEPICPRILISGSEPTSPVGTRMFMPGTTPCRPRPMSAMGRLERFLLTSTLVTAPVRLAFFCAPYPTTTTSLSALLSSFSTMRMLVEALSVWGRKPTYDTTIWALADDRRSSNSPLTLVT